MSSSAWARVYLHACCSRCNKVVEGEVQGPLDLGVYHSRCIAAGECLHSHLLQASAVPGSLLSAVTTVHLCLSV
jgi:hypothetical protein